MTFTNTSRCASCSVPLVFSAASLLAKDPKTGKVVPWNEACDDKWIDGSVEIGRASCRERVF